ncbi:MAG: SGNH/GDSL hydrolase family protein [Ruminococcus sp.]|nr:SGNH/GDSL hydrolase family protein [Ruminococcus sp.]
MGKFELISCFKNIGNLYNKIPFRFFTEKVIKSNGVYMEDSVSNRKSRRQEEAVIYENRYKGKSFSILGDSISTLEGYNPIGYKVFYSGEVRIYSGVSEMRDTWWGKVIEYFEGKLLVNNSWSGSRVTKLPGQANLFPSGCSDERTGFLHVDSIIPDIILIYLGTNDWANGVTPEHNNGEKSETSFYYAYKEMLRKIKIMYPDSEIWCCTLCETCMKPNPMFEFPYFYAGIHIEIYNDIIRKVVLENGCRLIDLYRVHEAYDSIDGIHPNSRGMDTIAELIIQQLRSKVSG